MRLTTQDKMEFLKAAVKADDLEELKRWLVAIVDAAEAAPSASSRHLARCGVGGLCPLSTLDSSV